MMKYNCIKIKDTQLLKFFRTLKEPLGMATIRSDKLLSRNLLKMGIRSEKGYVYFNELLFRAMKRIYGNFKINKEMQVFELRTLYKI